MKPDTPIFTNDAIVLGILLGTLALIFYSTKVKTFSKFYKVVPPILLCFFIPGLLSSFNVISAAESQLDETASRFLLPCCLVFFTLGIDFQSIKKLGGKALFVFLIGALGVMAGGPLGLMVGKAIDPGFLNRNGEEVWRGLATIAGSWTGGNANQLALKEIFQPAPNVFAQTSVIDVLFSELWLGLLLYFVGKATILDKKMKADATVIDEIRIKVETDGIKQKNPDFQDLTILMAVGFGITAFSHLLADNIAPFIETHYPALKAYSLASKSFWIVTIASSTGLVLSTTRARQLEALGATKFGTLFLYILITTIGMQLHIFDAFSNPTLLIVGLVWILTHAVFTLVAARLVRAPFFFTAVGSQANVGGVASASVVAAAFHPSLAPIGVLLAILGNAIGTYCGYITGLIMQWIAN
ncbi:DUF819 domain-containing protein [Emticicia sp. 21SJ11W-3]|uniref:DUF819 family protein n=1 Tax=Emticicia sp. 21SJ11W-3 TaxID=2916755 RepID=UPI0020A0EF70|nr:DUF819 family protein [Emticicia sp. 21SJ11W-3]UTA70185.1 DUF819 family protein [Emticicia sp. 21SJ11W-3]